MDNQKQPEVDQNKQNTEQVETNWKDQYIRALADYDNLKKNTAKTTEAAITKARNEVFKQLLPIYWDFHRAKVNNWISEEGITLLIDNLEKFFTNKCGLTILGDDIIGAQFNYETMSAVTTIPTEDSDKHNIVESVILPGLVDTENNVISHAVVTVYK